MKRLTGLMLVAFTMLFTASAFGATFVAAVPGGNWSTNGSWASGGVTGHRTPRGGDSVYIPTGGTITLTANATCSGLRVVGTLHSGTGLYALTVDNTAKAIYVSGTLGGASDSLSLTFGATANLAGAGTVSLYHFISNAGSTLTLGQDFTIKGDITLNGIVVMGNYTVTHAGRFPNSATCSATACFVTNGTGQLKRSAGITQNRIFPVSPVLGRYNPVIVSPAIGDPTETYGVRATTGIVPVGGDTTQGVAITWNISEGTAGGNHVKLSFQWAGAQEGSKFVRAASSIYQNASGSWMEASPGISAGTNPYADTSAVAISSFGAFTVANPGALPVQLASFKASSITSQGVKIEWQTASESNCNGFVVLRSSSVNGPFTAVSDFIGGNGTTVDAHSYNWTDASPLNGTNYYQLRQVDLDGHVTNYEPISVNVSVTGVTATGAAPHAFRLEQNYPNPFNPSTMIRFSVEKSGQTTLVVYNSLGQEVTKLFSGVAEAGRSYTVSFDGRGIASGIYFYRLSSETKSQVARMILVK
jgi:hypothetical protein